MEISKNLNKKNLSDIVIKSIIWNNIIDIFRKEKNIDIKDFLISIKLMGDTILIKTNKPVINSELLLLNTKIKKTSVEKLQKLGLRLKEFDIKYK